MKNEPVRVSAAILVLGAAIIALLTLVLDWSGDLAVLVSGIWAATIGVLDSVVIRNRVTPLRD